MHYSSNHGSISKFKINSYTARIYATNTNRSVDQDTFAKRTKHKCDEKFVVDLKNVYSNIRSTNARYTASMIDQNLEDVKLNISSTVTDSTVKKFTIYLVHSSKIKIRTLTMTFYKTIKSYYW